MVVFLNVFYRPDFARNAFHFIITYSLCNTLWLNQTLFFSLKSKWLTRFNHIRNQKKDEEYIVNAHHISDTDKYTKHAIKNSFSDNLWLIRFFHDKRK